MILLLGTINLILGVVCLVQAARAKTEVARMEKAAAYESARGAKQLEMVLRDDPLMCTVIGGMVEGMGKLGDGLFDISKGMMSLTNFLGISMIISGLGILVTGIILFRMARAPAP